MKRHLRDANKNRITPRRAAVVAVPLALTQEGKREPSPAGLHRSCEIATAL